LFGKLFKTGKKNKNPILSNAGRGKTWVKQKRAWVAHLPEKFFTAKIKKKKPALEKIF